jgi:hypothetical protein
MAGGARRAGAAARALVSAEGGSRNRTPTLGGGRSRRPTAVDATAQKRTRPCRIRADSARCTRHARPCSATTTAICSSSLG